MDAKFAPKRPRLDANNGNGVSVSTDLFLAPPISYLGLGQGTSVTINIETRFVLALKLIKELKLTDCLSSGQFHGGIHVYQNELSPVPSGFKHIQSIQ